MKKLFIAFIFILITGNLYSNPVDSVLVKTIAKNYFEFLNPSRTNIEIKNIITIYYNGYPSYYIVNFIGNGYIAVSANNATIPILMYSYGGEYKETDFHNPAYLDWMENYSKEIDSVRKIIFQMIQLFRNGTILSIKIFLIIKQRLLLIL